mmetsp:Transcript_41567/g.68165  ORF Transcript_41567/g.68165 Transcript_41567/m.68165 type:complete len:81 (+) Transcript_41567:74-316(+)
MYLQFREAFPTCHAVFSQIVSASSFWVQLATVFNQFNHSPEVDVGNVCDDTDDHPPTDNPSSPSITDHAESLEYDDDDEE